MGHIFTISHNNAETNAIENCANWVSQMHVTRNSGHRDRTSSLTLGEVKNSPPNGAIIETFARRRDVDAIITQQGKHTQK